MKNPIRGMRLWWDKWSARRLVGGARRAQAAFLVRKPMAKHPSHPSHQEWLDLQEIEGICAATARTVRIHA